jgi:DNA replication protein DnaC
VTITDAQLAAIADAAEQLRAVHLDSWQRTCPLEFADATLTDVHTATPAHHPAVIEGFDRWMVQPARFMVLAGNVGSGKTYMACAAARHFIDCGVSARFARWPKLVADEQQHRFTDQASGPSPSTEALRCGVLVLDDIGAGRGAMTEWEATLIDTLIAERAVGGFRTPIGVSPQLTILTTNLDVNALSAYLGERLKDRLRDGTTLLVTGSSRRGPRHGRQVHDTATGADR